MEDARLHIFLQNCQGDEDMADVALLKNGWMNATISFSSAGRRFHGKRYTGFRSVDGLYNQKYKYPPETILSYSFFIRNKAEFYEFYRDKMIFLDAKPNITHIKLAQLEAEGRLKAVITQNIDGLHQKAGSKTVLELHGSV